MIDTNGYEFLAPNYSPNKTAILSAGKRALLWDTSGKCYIDMIAGYSSANQGHSHPRLVAALTEQAKKLALCPRSYMNEKLGLLAQKLCCLTGLDMVLPSSGGVESVETAIKIARRWGHEIKCLLKPEILVFDGNFHGRSTTVISFSSTKEYQRGFAPLMKGFNAAPYGDFKAVEQLLSNNNNYCAVLVEPIQGEAGVIIPPRGWLKHLEILCDRYKVLLILDEIQSGLGRTGSWFAYRRENVLPDMVILGKSLGGGLLPISVVVGKKSVMEVLDVGSHGSTFGGNALASAVALEALQVIEDEGLVEKSRLLGLHMEKRLCAIQSPAIKAVRCVGLWAGIEIDPQYADVSQLCEILFEKGVMTKEAHNAIRLSPPLVITQFQLDQAIDKIEETLRETVTCRTS